MKHLHIFIFSLILFACTTEQPAETTTDEQPAKGQSEVKGEILVSDIVDGPHTYNARALDSLSYTYSSDKANLKDGLYYLPGTATATINLLPLELWEHLVSRNENFYHRAKPKDTWCAIHRIDRVSFSTAARPITVKNEGDEYTVTIPFDGTSSSKVATMIANRGKGSYGLLIDGRVTCIFYDSEGIEVDGLHYSTTRPEEVEYLKSVFNKTP